MSVDSILFFLLHFSPRNMVLNINDCGGLSSYTTAYLNDFINRTTKITEYISNTNTGHSQTVPATPKYIRDCVNVRAAVTDPLWPRIY